MRIEVFVVKTKIGAGNEAEKCKCCLTEREFRETTHGASCDVFPTHQAYEKAKEDKCYWLNRNQAQKSLDLCKQDLTKLFGGLTEIKGFNGYWKNTRGKIEADFGEIWLIYASNPELVEDARFKAILLEIKATTAQRSQAYAVNNDLRLI